MTDLADEEVAARDDKRAKKKARARRRLAASIGGAVVAVAGLALGFAALPDAQPEIHEARDFLKDYYAEAPVHPSQSWERTTESWRADLAGPRGQASAKYLTYWHTMRRVDVEKVQPLAGQSGWWSVLLVYHKKSGGSSPSRQHVELTCPTFSRLVRSWCTHDRIKLNAVDVQPHPTDP